MLVNDTQETRNVSVPPQHSPLWMQIKSSVVVGAVSVSLNLGISLREEDEFSSNSDATNTHNSSIQEGLKPIVYTTLIEERMVHSPTGQDSVEECT